MDSAREFRGDEAEGTRGLEKRLKKRETADGAGEESLDGDVNGSNAGRPESE